MRTAFDSKTMFLHNVPAVFGGDYTKIANWLLSEGFTAVLPKCVDGILEYTYVDEHGDRLKNVTFEFVQTMHSFGIAVIGWGFNYGNDGDTEGRVAAQVCDRLGLDGWAFDMESKLESFSDSVARAGKIIGSFRKTIVNKVPLAFCSWALYWSRVNGSQIHEPETAVFMMSQPDVLYIMPMVYWSKLVAGKPVQMTDAEVLSYLKDSVAMQRRITNKPVIPVLRAYTGDGGFANAQNILAAGNYANENFTGASWWFADHAADQIKFPGISEALRIVPGWETVVEPPPVPEPKTNEEKIAALEKRVSDIEAILRKAGML